MYSFLQQKCHSGELIGLLAVKFCNLQLPIMCLLIISRTVGLYERRSLIIGLFVTKLFAYF